MEGFGYVQVAQAQGEGFGGAASPVELAEVELGDIEAGVCEAGGEVDVRGAHDDVAAYVDDRAGELGGFGFGDGAIRFSTA